MLPEPPQAHDDDGNVDEAEVGDDGDKVQVQLLVRRQLCEVHAVTAVLDTMLACLLACWANKTVSVDVGYIRIQTRLGGRAGAKVKRVNGAHVAPAVQDRQGQQGAEEDPAICVPSQCQVRASCNGQRQKRQIPLTVQRRKVDPRPPHVARAKPGWPI